MHVIWAMHTFHHANMIFLTWLELYRIYILDVYTVRQPDILQITPCTMKYEMTEFHTSPFNF